MTPSRDRGQTTKSITVKPQTNIERDLFLELALPLTEDIDVVMNTALDRIELEIRGSYGEVYTVISKLSDLQDQIIAAVYPDKHEYYFMHNQILTKLCKPPVNLELFAASTSALGFDTEVMEHGLKTEAPLEDLIAVHRRVVDLRHEILNEFNRDIERFFIMTALKTNSDDIWQIVDTAIALDIIQKTDYGYQFALDTAEATSKLLDQLGIELKDALKLPENQDLGDIDLSNFGFDGGKIVFFKDGKEVEQPEQEDR